MQPTSPLARKFRFASGLSHFIGVAASAVPYYLDTVTGERVPHGALPNAELRSDDSEMQEMIQLFDPDTRNGKVGMLFGMEVYVVPDLPADGIVMITRDKLPKQGN